MLQNRGQMKVISDRFNYDYDVVVRAGGPIGHRVGTCVHLSLAEARHANTIAKQLSRNSGNTESTRNGDCHGGGLSHSS
jgi:hypothetical protein